MDSFYTPPTLADLLVSSCRSSEPSRIMDFAAGDGALLRSALRRWPHANISAMDIAETAIHQLSKNIPHANLRHEDFFNFSSCDRDQIKSDNAFDVILLNPPFSCRRNATIGVDINGKRINGSPALAFVARSLPYLKADGELIAILPSSCFTSERDAALRNAIRESWEIAPIGPSKSSAFPRCSVTVDIVRIARRYPSAIISPAHAIPKLDISLGRLHLMRGTMPNAKGSATRKQFQFVHSTDLIDGKVMPPTRWISDDTRTVSGTALLLPRVGRANYGKIVLKDDPAPIVLSDCVVALKTPERRDEGAVWEVIRRNWETFSQLWAGSCAQYLTLGRLEVSLMQFGYEVERVPNMAFDCRLPPATEAPEEPLIDPIVKHLEEELISAIA